MFNQLLQFFPRTEFQKAVVDTRAEHRVPVRTGRGALSDGQSRRGVARSRAQRFLTVFCAAQPRGLPVQSRRATQRGEVHAMRSTGYP